MRVPAMKNGRLMRSGLANSRPTNSGLIEAPIVRATPVIPPAADRSAGVTTVRTYDCLAGTSIWLMLNLRSRTATASGNVGISGTRIKRTFDGRCVKTIVLIKPNREARREATNADKPARMFAQKKTAPRVPGSTPKRKWNQ